MKKSILYILFALFSLSAAVSLTACKDDGVEISGANKSKTPKNVKLLEYGATSLTICWDFIRGATSYTVQLVDGDMNPVSEALCKTTDAIDYHEFTDLATDRIYYGRVRANYPYSSTSDWVYVTANEQPAMLMASVVSSNSTRSSRSMPRRGRRSPTSGRIPKMRRPTPRASTTSNCSVTRRAANCMSAGWPTANSRRTKASSPPWRVIPSCGSPSRGSIPKRPTTPGLPMPASATS